MTSECKTKPDNVATLGMTVSYVVVNVAASDGNQLQSVFSVSVSLGKLADQ